MARYPVTIGDRIRLARYEKCLTQKQLGEHCGIAEPTIRRYELGKLNPKYSTLEKIAAALDVTADYLQNGLPVEAEDVNPDLLDTISQRASMALDSIDSPEMHADLWSLFNSLIVRINNGDPVKVKELERFANASGVSIDYLSGRVDNKRIEKWYPELDGKIKDEIEDAENDLLTTVRDICDMEGQHSSLDYVAGNQEYVWNPMKIRLITAYLQESRSILKKMMNSLPNDVSAKEIVTPGGSDSDGLDSES